MSGFDKYQTVEALKAQGWTEAPELGEYMLRPPRELLERLAAMHFYVYDARDLQDFVGPSGEGFEVERLPNPLCKTCKFRSDGGYCTSKKISEDRGQSDHEKQDMLIYDYTEGGSFWAGPEFSCVHHESMPIINPAWPPNPPPAVTHNAAPCGCRSSP